MMYLLVQEMCNVLEMEKKIEKHVIIKDELWL